MALIRAKDIQAFGRKIAKEFKPQRVILFGSYAHGKPGPDSDVDLLVIMPFTGRNVDKSVEIRMKVHPPFPVDLLVRTPRAVRRRLAMGDPFMCDILHQGKVLYEAHHRSPTKD
jgi:uncharacterized protein